MNMTNQSAITQYCSYFQEQLKKVSMVEDRLYRKILLATMLDTWARPRYPSVQGNKDRFVHLIRDCANWADSNRISLPQLSLLLQTSPATAGSQLMREVDERLRRWEYGRIYRLDIDPWSRELEPFAATADERKLINNSCHADLLYMYRNHLVHEFREPGYGMEISDDSTTPYYHEMSNLQGHDTWELVYPIGFFIYIAKCSLDSLRSYLQNNDLDPYSFYEFGSIWKRR